MKLLIAVILFVIPAGILAQVGIKTSKQAYQQQQLNQDYELHSLSNQYQNQNDSSWRYYHSSYNQSGSGGIDSGLYHTGGGRSAYDSQYPALPPQGGNLIEGRHAGGAGTVVYVDKTVKFLNETRSRMASGVCHMEVPTATLVGRGGNVPKGNGSDPTLSKIRVCCDGYERNVHNFLQCDPVCKNDCINGICVAPDVCVCYPDHVRNYAGYCLATCPIGCGNGICTDAGTCECKPGYTLDPVSKKFCAPVCRDGCRNGNCTAPDVCECSDGFELNDRGACVPKCENCENGRCIEPGVCTCLPGYQRRNDECKAICTKECKNGFCAAPEICGCNPGLVLDGTGKNCVAHCDQPCLNGYCSGNNVCSCHTGYIQDELNPNLCRPNCPSGCPNGYCSSPNFCLCKAGFIKTGVKGRQVCSPVQN